MSARRVGAGFSLLELQVVLAVIAILCVMAVRLDPGSMALTAVQGELRACVEQAFQLARFRGCPVRVALAGPAPVRRGRPRRRRRSPLKLPRGVRWGLPHSGIPLPPGMGRTAQAHLTGQAHPCITVTPAHRRGHRLVPHRWTRRRLPAPFRSGPAHPAARRAPASAMGKELTLRIMDLSPDQRPRERLLAGRGEELSDADLLALLWGAGRRGLSAVEAAQELLTRCGGLAGMMLQGPGDWIALPGIGPARACQLWAAQELCRRGLRGGGRPRVNSPQACGAYLLPRCQGWTEERFGLLALNIKGESAGGADPQPGHQPRHPDRTARILQGGPPLRRQRRRGLPQPSFRRSHAQPPGHPPHPAPAQRRGFPGGAAE